VAREKSNLCKRPHYHVRKGNGKMRWQRYYSHDWAMQSARAWGGVIRRYLQPSGLLRRRVWRSSANVQRRGVNAS
jgi:hypothetical protein